MYIALFVATLIIPLCLNFKATKLILEDQFSGQKQKIIQCVLVWLLPLVGALLVLMVHRPIEPPARQYRKIPDAGDDYGYSGKNHQSVKEALDD